MKNNEELQNDVQEAIKWQPLLHAAEIGVTAKDGVVSLTAAQMGYLLEAIDWRNPQHTWRPQSAG